MDKKKIFIPKKIDVKTTNSKREKWASVKIKKEKEYIPYPFEDYITNEMKEGESFSITKDQWFDHINEIRKNQGKGKTKAGPSIFMMMKSKKVNMEDEGKMYDTIDITKMVDEKTGEHLGWNIKKVWKPYYQPVKNKKKEEEEKK